ncbi:GRAM domain-containing protein 2B-like isoform X2 [Scleropages formosus]|uniref:GRAM domain-containing protein 2B-like isoform X2 n=1 Tax=Scleropages formosus TaxID=113540 RepID=UPI0010FA9F4D|nr:GRAM domain-containing protein 2B-like isoform X2 [Scleropages formosus]
MVFKRQMWLSLLSCRGRQGEVCFACRHLWLSQRTQKAPSRPHPGGGGDVKATAHAKGYSVPPQTASLFRARTPRHGREPRRSPVPSALRQASAVSPRFYRTWSQAVREGPVDPEHESDATRWELKRRDMIMPTAKERFRSVKGQRVFSSTDGDAVAAKVRKAKSMRLFDPRKTWSLEESQLGTQDLNKHQSKPIRAQTFDSETHSEKPEAPETRSSFIKHNKTFHRLFRDIPESEELTHSFTCALQKEVLYHGKLYVSENYLCFHSSVLLKETKVVVPVANVRAVKKQNTALVVPNALSVRTADGEKYLFTSLRNRESCYKLLCSVCLHVEDRSANSSPQVSSAENGLDRSRETVRMPSGPRVLFRCAHDDGSIAGVAAVERSASRSLPQTLSVSSVEDSMDLPEEADSPLIRPNREAPRRGSGNESSEEQDVSSGEESRARSWVWAVTETVKSVLIQTESRNVNLLLIFYLVLVLLLLVSSGYIGLRIVALEEQLSSMGALPQFSLPRGYKNT